MRVSFSKLLGHTYKMGIATLLWYPHAGVRGSDKILDVNVP